MKTSLKDWPKVYQKIKRMRGMTLKEKVLLAQGLAATPDERNSGTVIGSELPGGGGSGQLPFKEPYWQAGGSGGQRA